MFLKKIKTSIILILSALMISNATLCNYAAKTKYQNLINQYPDLKNELSTMSNYALPVWYTDRDSNSLNTVKDTLQNCDQSTSVIIVFGLPNRDCDAGESTQGSNKNTNDYLKFITDLHDQVSNKEIIYILEPDALSLSIQNKCGTQNNYINNIKQALNILSQNNNAKIYLDIGYWILIYDEQQIRDFLNIVNIVDPEKKIKGFSLNLSNYRSNDESINSCKRIRDISGIDYKCIVDTSRNANGPSVDNTWCNLNSAGIGNVPTDNTGISFIDYFLWIKPAIEVDGFCQGSDNSYKSNNAAGSVDITYFKKIWDQGMTKDLQKKLPSLPPQPVQPAQSTFNLRCVSI